MPSRYLLLPPTWALSHQFGHDPSVFIMAQLPSHQSILLSSSLKCGSLLSYQSSMLTVQDAIVGLADSLRAAQIDPAIQSISGSPMRVHQAKQPEELLRLQSQASLSPVKQGKLADVFGHPSTNSSPSSDKQKMIRDSPTWRHSAQQSDNVFDSSGRLQYSSGQGKSSHPSCLLSLC